MFGSNYYHATGHATGQGLNCWKTSLTARDTTHYVWKGEVLRAA